MTRVNLVILGLLVWTSLSAADDDIGTYDYLGEDEDMSDVDNVSYDEETTEALSAEGKECLLQLISDCLAENDGSAEACEWLTKQLDVSVLPSLRKLWTNLCIFRASRTTMSRICATCPGRLGKLTSKPRRSLT